MSYFTLCRHVYVMSKLGQLRTCLNLMTTRQNSCYAARVILRFPMSSSITAHLKSLHWLPVKVGSTYNITCLCYHYHSSTASSYVADMLFSIDLHTVGQHLVNARFLLLLLFVTIPNVRCDPSLSSFKSRLKTYLYRSVYKD